MTGAEETSLSPAEWAGRGAPAPGARAPRRRLFRKYALIFVALVGAALLINSGFDFWFSYQENKAALVRVQQEKAESAAQRIAEFVEEIKSQIGWTTHAQWALGPLDQRRQDYFRLLRQVPAITELTQLDGAGNEQLKVSRLALDVVGSEADFSQSPAFIESKAHRAWFSPVYFRKESEPYMTLAMARDGRNAGVTVAEINLKLIWDVITALKIGQSGYAYVVDGRGRLIAHPDISLVLRDTDLSKLPQVAAALNPRPGQAAVATADNLAGRAVLTAHAAIPQLGWRVFVEVPLSEAFAPLYGAAVRTLVLLAFGLVAAALVALVIARRMTGPIHAIAAGAAEIGAGDLGRRIEIHTGDELEGLAQQFNSMAAHLQKSYAELEQRVADRTAELSEALEQQTATAEVLGVINSSPGDLAPVFNAMLEKALRLCDAALGHLYIYDGERFEPAAALGDPEFSEWLFRRGTIRPVPNSPLSRILKGERCVEIPDARETEAYRAGGGYRELVDSSGTRTHLAVPLRKDGAVLGVITIYRQEVRPFSDKQIALLQNFAAQAVIAMENARLITETREALEQQTATAEVLGVINSSPGDLAPVFDAMLEKAMRLCEGAFGTFLTYDGELFHAVVHRGVPAELVDSLREPGKATPGGAFARLVSGEAVVHLADIADDDAYRLGLRGRVAMVDIGGARTAIWVALRKDDALIGTLVIYRQEVRPFSDKQIALLQNFAAQAVIAMENARLITETQEALEQQTATAEILRVISSAPTDVQPTFDAIARSAAMLCDAVSGVFRFDGSLIHFVAHHGWSPAELTAVQQVYPMPPGSGSVTTRSIETRAIVHKADITADRDYVLPALAEAGFRTALSVPMLRDGVPLGAISVTRGAVEPFSEAQIELLKTFADQAVIAIENVRLITETREALEQQTATAEVLGVINSSPGELVPVFDAMLEKAMRLCGAFFGELRTYDGDAFHTAATRGVPEAFVRYRAHNPPPHGPGTGPARILAGQRLIHDVDLTDSDAYRNGEPNRRALVELGGVRTSLQVALRRDETVLGSINIYRQEVWPFSDKEVALLQNFAAQAVIAMENARLITETREALEQQTATAEVLQVISNSLNDTQPVFDAIVHSGLRLFPDAAINVALPIGGQVHAVAIAETDPALAEAWRRRFPAPLTREYMHSAAILDQKVVDIPDARNAPPEFAVGSQNFLASGYRAVTIVPMLRGDAAIGALSVVRQAPGPLSDKQLAVLRTFANQAVIAIENTRLLSELRDRTRDLQESLEYQTATSDVLSVISRSDAELEPVLENLVETAARLCQADQGFVFRKHQDGLHYLLASYGLDPEFRQFMIDNPFAPDRGTLSGRVAIEGQIVHIDDAASDPEYTWNEAQQRGNLRTGLGVPLLRDETQLGIIILYRSRVERFTDKQITLAATFADQAVIAIENARLLGELRGRTRDLQESLEYQTATSDVLKVISQSGTDLDPALDTLVETAARLCAAERGIIWRLRGQQYHLAASFGFSGEFKELLAQNPIEPGRGTLGGRTLAERRPVQIHDAASDPEYTWTEAQQLGEFHSMLGVPLFRGDTAVGVIALVRSRVEPFSDKEVQLVTTFADQAVIAIENARLLNELRSRTDDLQESLEYQTATSDVLKVISQSTFDLQPVLETLADTAARLCDAEMAFIFRRDGELYRLAASVGFSPETRALVEANPILPGRGTITGRTALTASVVHIPDTRLDPEYTWGEFIRVARTPTMLGAPLLREGVPVGVIVLARQRVQPFSDKQVALVRTFADQAVIAIENARLLNELRSRTDELARSVEELKALAEVGQEVSSTLDLGAVLSTILNRSVGLTEADAGVIFRYSEGERAFHLAEAVGWNAALIAQVRDMRIDQTATLMGEAVTRRAPGQIADLRERASNVLRDATLAAGYRSVLVVPLVGADEIFGALLLQRRRPGEFPEAEVRLMQTLAAQSVLAIQNAGLFREIADKSEQLALASQHKSQFLANMSHELRTPLNAILGYSELLVDGIYGAVPERAMGVLERVQNNGKHLLALINDVLDLSKIEAGQLVLTLEDYALPDVVHSVVSAAEGLANTKGLKFSADVAPGLPTGHGDARRLSQVLLNLVGNAIKFTEEGEVAVGAMAENGHFVLTVRDTGPGIAPEDHDKIFGEFQQVDNSNTRKKGGTGLGLAISKRMVEMQGGSIVVESKLGHGATFRVTLPIRVEHVADELAGELMGAA